MANSKYTKRRVDRICKLMAEDDYTHAEICKHAGISEATFYMWKAERPEFLEALNKAEEKRLDKFKQAARSGLLTLLQGKEYEETSMEFVEGKDGKPKIKNQKKVKKVILPNPTSVIFALKNLDSNRFSDVIKQEHSGRIDGGITGIEIVYTSKDEFEKQVNEDSRNSGTGTAQEGLQQRKPV